MEGGEGGHSLPFSPRMVSGSSLVQSPGQQVELHLRDHPVQAWALWVWKELMSLWRK